ncbi:calcium-translocating P-type ATPase [Gonapodya prolifera JEL478]|uniref:Calcium-transporting ATPase 2 n=1 Tax=Gonapodya prolifera (strain JEL478) TaxID=1344416 RepID=A0A139AFR9_GONPJ|nr:calcium-translocating P-type ATPase [Gonapodya prolifera JEL478]|eukprot:KXS15608.1 calcium-translocating P-type ATPase [Gonapodya prolifera JEL478]
MAAKKEQNGTAGDSGEHTGPFPFSAEKLQHLFDPKSTSKLEELGGVEGLCRGLKVDPSVGLSADDGHTPLASVAVGGTTGSLDSTPLVGDTGVSSGAHSAAFADRISVFGRNVLPEAKSQTLIQLMIAAFQDKILILLTIAALVSLAVGLYEDLSPSRDPTEPQIHWIEGVAIILAVLIVVLSGSINDYQKEKQFRALNAKKDDRQVKLFRSGATQLVSVYDIVVGDIFILDPGEVVPVDGVLVQYSNLKCDESAATGESDAVKKGPQDQFVISGGKVIEGVGRCVVCAVGEHSFFGKTMLGLRTEAEDTPLQAKLDSLAGKIAKMGASAALLMLIVLILKYVITVVTNEGFGSNCVAQECATEAIARVVNIVISAITIVVVAVPEGLPLAVTLALAFATTRMLKDNNLVRVLAACETMGGATTVCSDKTGTLTQNRMTVVKGVLGRHAHFAGDIEIKSLRARLRSTTVSPGASTGIFPRPLPGEGLLDVFLESVAVNSSAFEGMENGVRAFVGSKTEVALLDWAEKVGGNVDFKAYRDAAWKEQVCVYPFASERKSMATIFKIDRNSKQPAEPENKGKGRYFYRVYIKGASEIVLRYCSHAALLPLSYTTPIDHEKGPYIGEDPKLAGGSVAPLDEKATKDYIKLITSYADQSLRTICLAYRDIEEDEFDALVKGEILAAYRAEDAKSKAEERKSIDRNPDVDIALELGVEPESLGLSPMSPVDAPSDDVADPDLKELLSSNAALDILCHHSCVCLGIVGIEDPLRPGVTEAVKDCQNAGVIVRMVTGDNISTARAIATQCGIYQKGFGLCMEGSVFRALPQAQMDAIIPRLQVLARSSPTDKQILVGRLKALGETVAVTGDGTNDGPALKMADVGFSMGIAGTEVAKEASAIILMDDNFASIVKAMMWGRAVNDSVKKFLQFQLTVNITAVLLTFISAVSDGNQSSVLTAVQLLFVNLIMDTLAALALATDQPTREILNRPPENKQAPLITRSMWKMIICQAIFQVTVGMVLIYAGPSIFRFTWLSVVGGLSAGTDFTTTPTGWTGTMDEFTKELEHERRGLGTIVFNTFVFMQVFNMINTRRVDNNVNVFKGIFSNWIFLSIFLGIIAVQILIVFFGGEAFKVQPISGGQWAVCIIVGLLALPIGLVARLMPDDIFFWWT